MTPRYMPVRDAARHFGCSPSALYGRRKRGQLDWRWSFTAPQIVLVATE